jgi:hypothetical protein
MPGCSATRARMDASRGDSRFLVKAVCLDGIPLSGAAQDPLTDPLTLIGWTPARIGYPVDPPSDLPSAVHSSANSADSVSTTASARSGSTTSNGPPLFASFQSAIFRSGLLLSNGRHSIDIPTLVRLNTEHPGSSARTVAYLADHRAFICGPSMSNAITKFGPTDRTISATVSLGLQPAKGDETRQ